jgi:hypothetical protein
LADASASALGLSVDAVVVQSQADASDRPSGSQAAASSDGLLLTTNAGPLAVDAIHSDASSSGSGSSYVASIGGNVVGSSQQLSPLCTAVPAITLACVSASGGASGSRSQAASLSQGGVSAAVGDTASSPASAGSSLGSTGGSGGGSTAGSVAGPTNPNPAATTSVRGALAGLVSLDQSTNSGRAAPSGSLPPTGGQAWFLLVVGLAVCALGGAILTMAWVQ